jgi:hypothetical protein
LAWRGASLFSGLRRPVIRLGALGVRSANSEDQQQGYGQPASGVYNKFHRFPPEMICGLFSDSWEPMRLSWRAPHHIALALN